VIELPKLKLCHFPFFFQANFYKLRKAYGMTSQTIRNKHGQVNHWLLFDLDNCTPREFLSWMHHKFGNYVLYTSYPTPHGWHFIVWESHSFMETAKILVECPCIDQKWVKIGFKRGYWFLENRKAIDADNYMVVQRV